MLTLQFLILYDCCSYSYDNLGNYFERQFLCFIWELGGITRNQATCLVFCYGCYRSRWLKPEPYPPIWRAELGILKVLLTPTFHNTYSKQKDSYKFISQEKCSLAEEVSFSYCYEGRTKVLRGGGFYLKKLLHLSSIGNVPHHYC